jgi:hypothetical protein
MAMERARRWSRWSERRRAAAHLLVGAVLASGVAGPPTPAAAAPVVQCGQPILTDVTLRADLTCAGDGLVVGADGVTVDLGGHTVRGDGTGVGVAVTAHHRVTVRRGVVEGFAGAVNVDGSSDVTLSRLTTLGGGGVGVVRSNLVVLREVRSALRSSSTSDLRVIGGRLAGDNMFLSTMVRASFDGVRISGRMWGFSAPGIWFVRCRFLDASTSFLDAPNTVYRDNTFLNSSAGPNDSDLTLFEGNLLVNSSLNADGRSRGLTIRDNVFRRGSTALSIGPETPRYRIENNVFEYNDFGIRGLAVIGPAMNGLVVRHNVFRHNRVAGVYLSQRPGLAAESQMTFDDNVFRHNGHANGGLLDSAGRPVDDGLHLDGLVGPGPDGVVISRNRTRDNADYGIEVAPGPVHDGGGNTSVGDPSGCLGVTCAPPSGL